jgi:hypothetical protein
VLRAELVAHLVRDEVDREGVPDRVRDRRAGAALEGRADHAQAREPTAGRGHHQVGEVVAGGAQDPPRDGVGAVERLALAALQLLRGVTGGRAARAVRPGRGRVRVEVELVVARDQHQAHREVLLVDLVEPVDQHDLGRRRRARGRRRVVRVREQRQPVDAQRDRVAAGRDGARRERPCDTAARFAERWCGGRLTAVGDVLPVARVDVPGARRRAHRRVEADRREVQPGARGRVVEPARGVGLDLRVRGRQPRFHDRRLGHGEALEAATGAGKEMVSVLTGR